jgi:hypothetical protein
MFAVPTAAAAPLHGDDVGTGHLAAATHGGGVASPQRRPFLDDSIVPALALARRRAAAADEGVSTPGEPDPLQPPPHHYCITQPPTQRESSTSPLGSGAGAPSSSLLWAGDQEWGHERWPREHAWGAEGAAGEGRRAEQAAAPRGQPAAGLLQLPQSPITLLAAADGEDAEMGRDDASPVHAHAAPPSLATRGVGGAPTATPVTAPPPALLPASPLSLVGIPRPAPIVVSFASPDHPGRVTAAGGGGGGLGQRAGVLGRLSDVASRARRNNKGGLPLEGRDDGAALLRPA